ncbi:unnamed protein product [Brassica rapa subsp. trilocularis]
MYLKACCQGILFFRYVPLHTILSQTTVSGSAVSDTESSSSFKAPVIGGEGREATASASNTFPAAKIEIRGGEAKIIAANTPK